jgi:hypothetical protein
MNLEGFPIHRATYHDDLVPHLPPRHLLPDVFDIFSFRHHAAEYHIRRGMEVTLACDEGRVVSPLVFQQTHQSGIA